MFPETIEAIERVEANANKRWKEWAMDAIWTVAQNAQEFSSDDIWRVFDEWSEKYGKEAFTHEPRAMGAMLVKASRLKWIEKKEAHFRVSDRPIAHNRPMQVWKSRVYAWGTASYSKAKYLALQREKVELQDRLVEIDLEMAQLLRDAF